MWLLPPFTPKGLLESARRLVDRLRGKTQDLGVDYHERLGRELSAYERCFDVNALPDIFHYWSNRYLAPKFQRLGVASHDDFFAKYLHEAAATVEGGRAAFVSVGSGNCDTEVRVARLLRDRGLEGFGIECLDINPVMLERGRDMARAEGVGEFLSFTAVDFNAWRPTRPYQAVMAHQSLHHVVNLEGLFDSVQRAIKGGGLFVVSDIVGRNGHQRWPEARAIVEEFWQEMPEGYRYNHLLRRLEKQYMDWDCSAEAFEGIRAQDILPLLVDRFEFDLFAAFANVIDPFIDRGFGHNFNAAADWDREFIDRVHLRDEAEIFAGRIKPTHMMAVMCLGRPGRSDFLDGLQPRACIRTP